MDYDSDVTDAGLVLWHVKTKGRGGEDVNRDLEVIPSAAFAGQQMVSVHVLGAPGMLRGSGRAWSSGVIPYPLTWADGTSIPLRLDVAPLQDGGDRVTLAWGNFPSTRLPIASRKVFYYSRGEASAQVGTIDARFEPATLSTYAPGQFGSWSHIVGNATELFFYNMQSGQTALGEVDADGRFTTKSTQDGFKAGWTNIVRHNGYLFFYDRGTGTGTVGLFKGGRFTELNRWENGFSAGWTHVVSLPPSLYCGSLTPGGLLFYNASSGAAVVGDWDLVKGGDGFGEIVRVDFRERQRYPPGALRGGWTQIVATTDGVLFYNGSDGRAVLADVRGSGIIDTRPQTESTLERGWTHVVAVNEQVLFYNRTSGEAALGTTLIRTMQGDSTKPLLRGSLIMRRTYAGVFPSNLSHIVTTVDPAPSPQ